MSEHKEIAQGVKPPKPEEVIAAKSKEEAFNARVAELCENNTRRGLEKIARDVGIEPSKEEYPNMESLAKAIAEKEAA